MEPILKGRNLVKRYGRVVALDNCDFDLSPGRNPGRDRRQRRRQVDPDQGVSGAVTPDEGKIWLEGKEVKFHSPIDAPPGRHRDRLPDARHVAGAVDRRQHVHGPRTAQARLHGQMLRQLDRKAMEPSPATSSMNSA
jgi:fructose transport system ATP-binding protein